MDRSTRRRLRLFAWLVFLLAAPLLLAYTRGYRFSLFHLGRVGALDRPAVGALVVQTIPRGATLRVDGAIADERTPTGLGNVRTGPHTVRIEKEGYRPWEKTVEISGGKVERFVSVRLLPVTLEEDIVRAGVTGVWASPDSQWLLAWERGGLRILPLRTADTDTGRVVRLPAKRLMDLRVSWSPGGTLVALGAGPGDVPATVFGVLEVSTGRVEPTLEDEHFVGWLRRGSERVVLLDADGNLSERGPRSKETTVLATGVHTAAAHPRGILIARSAGGAPTLAILSDGEDVEPLAPPPPEAPKALTVSASGHIALVGEQSGMLFILPRGADRWQELVRVTGAPQWSPDGRKLLYQESSFDASVVNVSEERSPLPLGVPELLLRLSVPLDALRWFPDSQYVLFTQRDILSLVEIDPRGGHRLEVLTATDRGSTTVVPSRDGDTLLFVARRDSEDVLSRLFLRTPGDR